MAFWCFFLITFQELASEMGEVNLTAKELKIQLKNHINPEKAAFYPKFFKAFPGGYGEGDQFLGVTVVNQKKVCRKFAKMPMRELQVMIEDPFHEVRLSALHIANLRYPKADDKEKRQWFQFIDQNMERLNGWDWSIRWLTKSQALIFGTRKTPRRR